MNRTELRLPVPMSSCRLVFPPCTRTHTDQQTLALLPGPTAAQESHQNQDGPDRDAEEAHVDEQLDLRGERTQEVQEGGAAHAHPDPHSQQEQTTELQEDPEKPEHEPHSFTSGNRWTSV